MKCHYHCVYDLKYHLVLATKYRKKCFTPKILSRLEEICSELCTKWEITLVEFGGEKDHIHLLFAAHPAMQVSRFINNLKTVSSRLIRKEFKAHFSMFYWKPVLWSRAYCIQSTGGVKIEIIKNT